MEQAQSAEVLKSIFKFRTLVPNKHIGTKTNDISYCITYLHLDIITAYSKNIVTKTTYLNNAHIFRTPEDYIGFKFKSNSIQSDPSKSQGFRSVWRVCWRYLSTSTNEIPLELKFLFESIRLDW